MRPKRIAVLLTLGFAVALAGCGSQGGQGNNNVFVDSSGNRRCAYISQETKQVYCGKSDVDPSFWTSPSDNVFYHPEDGMSDEELALETLLKGWPQVKHPKAGDASRVERWRQLNPDFETLLKQREAALSSPTPSPGA